MLRNTRLKLTYTHHLVMTIHSNFLAFHTFLTRQTNLKTTSSVLSVKQDYYDEILDGTSKRK